MEERLQKITFKITHSVRCTQRAISYYLQLEFSVWKPSAMRIGYYTYRRSVPLVMRSSTSTPHSHCMTVNFFYLAKVVLYLQSDIRLGVR